MSRRDFFGPGDWNAICSMCGRKRKASSMVRNWQGMYRCREHNENRHPQDFVQGVQEHITPPWTQPPKDIEIYFCSLEGLSAIPDYAMPDCMIPDSYGSFGVYYPPVNPPVELCTIEGSTSIPSFAVPGCLIPGNIPDSFCTLEGRTGIPGEAIPGCSTPGNV